MPFHEKFVKNRTICGTNVLCHWGTGVRSIKLSSSSASVRSVPRYPILQIVLALADLRGRLRTFGDCDARRFGSDGLLLRHAGQPRRLKAFVSDTPNIDEDRA